MWCSNSGRKCLIMARTGMAAALTFLKLNGKTVTRHTDDLYAAMIAIAERRIGKPELAALLRRLAG